MSRAAVPGFRAPLLGGAIDPLTRGWVVVAGAGLVRMALGFVASVALARVFGPADFGVYSLLAASVGIAGAVAEGGLTDVAVQRMAAVWPADPSKAAARGQRFFWLRVGLASAAMGVACLAAGPLAARVVGLPDDGGLLRWALVGVVATAMSGATGAMLQATGAFGRMSSLTLANAGLTAVLAVALALVGRLSLISALVVLGIGTSLATFVLGWRLLPPGWTLTLPSLRDLRREAGPLVRTGRWLWLGGMFAMLGGSLDVLLLNRWGSLESVGIYALALNLASKADVVNHSLYTVLLPSASTLGRDPSAVGGYVRRSLLRAALICAALAPVAAFAEPAIVLVYGPAFAPAAALFRLLLGVVAFDVLATPILLLALGLGRPRVLAAADAARAGTLGLMGVWLIPAGGGPGAAAARLASRLVGAAVVLIALRGTLAFPFPGRRSDPR